MKNLEFLPIETVLEEYYSITGRKEPVDEDLILKVANDVIKKVSSQDQYRQKVALLYVDNYTVELPEDFHKVIQLAYRREDKREKVTSKDLVEWTYKNYNGIGCDVNVEIDCPECSDKHPSVTIDADRIEQLNNPQYMYQHSPFLYRWGGLGKNNEALSGYNETFKLLKPAQNNFFASEYHIPGCLNLQNQLTRNSEVKYSLEYPKILVNTEKCEILMSYFAVVLDDNGYRKVPDNPYVYEAIVWKAEQMIHYQKFANTGETKYENASDRAYQRFRQAYTYAKSALEEFDFDTWFTFMQNHWTKIIPNYDSRENFDRDQGSTYNPPRI